MGDWLYKHPFEKISGCNSSAGVWRRGQLVRGLDCIWLDQSTKHDGLTIGPYWQET